MMGDYYHSSLIKIGKSLLYFPFRADLAAHFSHFKRYKSDKEVYTTQKLLTTTEELVS